MAFRVVVLFCFFQVRREIGDFFFFSSRRRHTRWPRDWSSDVCSSDLEHLERDLWTHCPDPETARASAQRLQQIAAHEDALLLYGHDAAQWQTLQLSPGFYD